MAQCTQPSNAIRNVTGIHSIVSVPTLIECTQCPQARFFKGQRGLKIHQKRMHSNPVIPLSAPVAGAVDVSVQNSISTPDLQPFWKVISQCKTTTPVLKRIPRGARISVATALSQAIRNVVSKNTKQAWEHLLVFPYIVLHVQNDLGNKLSLTVRIKQNCVRYSARGEHTSFMNADQDLPTNSKSQKPLTESTIYKLVESKLSDGDIKGASRILFSSDTIAPNSNDTLISLESKHPSAGPNLHLPDPPQESDGAVDATSQDVLGAVMSFQSGSAGGLDAVTPQHLKDLLSGGSGHAGEVLLGDMTSLINLMLSGRVNGEITELLYGANLCALKKKDGGIRPIAVGTTYRRLAAKVCCRKEADYLGDYFRPVQLGFGSRGGCEAAVHSLRTFLDQNYGEVILKVDIKNAFNSVDRGALLNEIKNKIPEIYPFLWQCYASPSKLIYRNNVISSAVGCQQGDPLGPAIFSLAIHPIIQRLQSKLNVWYLDDGTLGGDVDTVFGDLKLIIDEFQKIGLELNFSKCELFVSGTCVDKNYIIDKFNSLASNITVVDKCSLRLLGSPIFDESIPAFVDEKIQNFNKTSDRLLKINSHMAFTIIKFCLFVPKFTYSLRCCQLWKHSELVEGLDNIIKTTLSSVLNIYLDDRAWSQASLPVKLGGLGIRKISSVALPAFLSSVYSTNSLVEKILNPSLLALTGIDLKISYKDEARNAWHRACPDSALPKSLSAQRQWDGPLCELTRNSLLQTCSSSADRARLLAVSKKESGFWLQALPSHNTGTLMDPVTFRIATCLRLGARCCAPHHCQCGTAVEQLGHHGLSCTRAAGRISRHASLNDIIRRAFTSVNVPAILEPNGLLRDDGKRPDGMTLVPWELGRPLVWDATCVDTLAPSHLSRTSARAGAAADSAEDLKRRKYAGLDRAYTFVPLGVETLGPWGTEALRVFKIIAGRLVAATRDPRAGDYLGQRISIAIQRGNAASVLGTLPIGTDLDQLSYL